MTQKTPPPPPIKKAGSKKTTAKKIYAPQNMVAIPENLPPAFMPKSKLVADAGKTKKPQAATKADANAVKVPGKTPGVTSALAPDIVKPKVGRAGPMVRVKTSHKRSLSSTIWLQRQLNDPYVVAAKQTGFRSRAAFKIVEIDEKFNIFKRGQLVVDLGAAPGGWTQYVVQKTGSDNLNDKKRGTVVALDILPMDPIDGALLLQADFSTEQAVADLIAALGGKKADVIMSDLAPNTTGHQSTDHLGIVHLIEIAWGFAAQVLAPNGVFITKVFQGGATQELLQPLRRAFKSVRHMKPPASRQGSPEMYLVAQGFKGARI